MPLYVPSSSGGSSFPTGLPVRAVSDTSTGDTIISIQVQIDGVWITVASVTNP